MRDSKMIGREKEEKEKTNILFYRIDEHTYLDTNIFLLKYKGKIGFSAE